ncbi:MAG: aminoglycoside phosphotransferase family protein [Actinomycetota bacterium]|nr:aminoglycoside phosphotransferase family protein [Actinomycetota bacterium]
MRLIAQGRDCDVFDLGDGTVLRRRRDGRSLEPEGDVMRHVAAHGFPCPIPHSVTGADMVLDRLDGPTMAEALLADPTTERLREAGHQLATLHDLLHEAPPLVAGGGCLLHLDLHPENVLMTHGGPVVIDWTNAAHGPPEVDVAMTWVILEPLRVFPEVDELLVAFLHASGLEKAKRSLRIAIERRLADANITEHERTVVRSLAEEQGGHSAPVAQRPEPS